MDFVFVNELLENKNYAGLRKELSDALSADIAEFLDGLEKNTALLVFRLLPKDKAADVFSYLAVETQAELVELVHEKELANILNDLFFDDKVDLLEEMPANVVKKILRNTTEAERKLINQFLMYPDYSAGSLMTIEFVDLKKEMLVEDALGKIRRIGVGKESIYTCFVIDAERHLEGTVSLRDLVLAPVDVKVEDIMLTDPLYVHTHDDQEDIADLFKKYDLLMLPVVDNERRLVGIITIDDVVDVIEEETTEDIYRMGAVQPTEEEYISAGVFELAKKRVLWLLILMLSATFTGYIIRNYEATLQSAVVLAAFIPMLMNTGGNAGSQASTIAIRSIVLGDIQFKDIPKVVWKEIKISVLVGTVLAAINFLRVYYLEGYSFIIALTVAATLVCTVIIAKVLGGVLPLIAKKVGVDPAIMASPLITTIVDAVSLMIYFRLVILFGVV